MNKIEIKITVLRCHSLQANEIKTIFYHHINIVTSIFRIKSNLSPISLSKEIVSGAPLKELVRTSFHSKIVWMKCFVTEMVKHGTWPFI